MNSHQLEWMIKKIEVMSANLGGNGADQIDIPEDEFEKARQQFQLTMKIYQKKKQQLNQGKIPQQMAKLRFHLRDHSLTLKEELKVMIKAASKNDNAIQKLQKKQKRDKKTEEKLQKLKQEKHYKDLVLLNCNKGYGLLFSNEDQQNFGGGAKVVQLSDLLKQHATPLLDAQDSEGDSLILDQIKAIDDVIESQLDEIIQGINKMNRNAKMISEAIEETHRQIILNVKILSKNEKDLDNSNQKLKKYLKHCRRSYCFLDVILVLLLLLLFYIGYKQFQ